MMKGKIGILIASFVIIYIFNFWIPRLMPGNPFLYSTSVAGEDNVGEFTTEQKEAMEKYYGLDKPIFSQFKDTVINNLHGDFGLSIHYKKSVSSILIERLPWTIYIMASTLFISFIVGIVLALIGIKNNPFDVIIYSVLSIITEFPPFIIGILLLFCIAANISSLPLSGAVTAFAKYQSESQWLYDVFIHSIMPISALCFVTIPKFYFTARGSFISILEKPYLTNAKAKGLKDRIIYFRYIFLNGITPVIARLFLSVGATVGGTLLVENVFAYPGLGTVIREAVRFRDYPMIQGVFLLSAVIVLISLLVADIINDFIDRRGINK